MDLRWSDRTGDTFALRSSHIISRLLLENRPNWAQAQDVGIFDHFWQSPSIYKSYSTVHHADELSQSFAPQSPSIVAHCRKTRHAAAGIASCCQCPICLFVNFSIHLNLCPASALILTKRDSSTANLASPRFLRMDAWSSPMSATRHRPSHGASSSSGPGWPLSGSYAAPKAAATSTYGCTPEFDTGPMPRSDDSWNLFPDHPFQHELHQNQRVLHTQVFKQLEVGQGPNKQKQLWVTEIDAEGTERLRRPECFFHGIVGHVKDKWGYPIHGWKEVANYWHRYFDITEVPCHFHQTEPHENRSHHETSEVPAEDLPIDDDGDDTSQVEFPEEVRDPAPSAPAPWQISQLAHILYNMLLEDPDFNAPIIELLQAPPADPSESSLPLFTSAELAQLASHLAVTGSRLATGKPRGFPCGLFGR